MAKVWQWADGRRWVSYTAAQQRQLEQHVRQSDPTGRNLSPLVLDIAPYGKYTLDFARMVQINADTQFCRKIRWVPATDLMGNEDDEDEDDEEDEDEEDDEEDEEDDEDEDEDDEAETKMASTERKDQQDDIPLQHLLTSCPAATLAPTEQCGLCLDVFTPQDDVVIPSRCTGHYFHRVCPGTQFDIAAVMKQLKRCPSCRKHYGVVYGNMPPGTMRVHTLAESLPGHHPHPTLQLSFHFPAGTQDVDHPQPGVPYCGDQRVAFLPDTAEGRAVLALLQKAWQRRLLFTVGRSLSRNVDHCVIFNGIHLKTRQCSTASEPWGYPDPTYLLRVTGELNEKGVYADEVAP